MLVVTTPHYHLYAMIRFLPLAMLFCGPVASFAADGTARTGFTLDVPLARVVRKLDTRESLRRALQSQGIELVNVKRVDRQLLLTSAAVEGEFAIEGIARRFSPLPGQIRQTVHAGLTDAKLTFELVEPVGQLAAQIYTLDFVADGQKTDVDIEIYSRVYVPQRRLCCVQRLINRIARDRVAQELSGAIAKLRREIQAIATEPLPATADSLLISAQQLPANELAGMSGG